MMPHELLYLTRHEFALGQEIGVTIATRRGVFTGLASDRRRLHSVLGVRQADLPDLVDIWHPVPRWMSPSQVIAPFLTV